MGVLQDPINYFDPRKEILKNLQDIIKDLLINLPWKNLVDKNKRYIMKKSCPY